jgi:hypothetical protein
MKTAIILLSIICLFSCKKEQNEPMPFDFSRKGDTITIEMDSMSFIRPAIIFEDGSRINTDPFLTSELDMNLKYVQYAKFTFTNNFKQFKLEMSIPTTINKQEYANIMQTNWIDNVRVLHIVNSKNFIKIKTVPW